MIIINYYKTCYSSIRVMTNRKCLIKQKLVYCKLYVIWRTLTLSFQVNRYMYIVYASISINNVLIKECVLQSIIVCKEMKKKKKHNTTFSIPKFIRGFAENVFLSNRFTSEIILSMVKHHYIPISSSMLILLRRFYWFALRSSSGVFWSAISSGNFKLYYLCNLRGEPYFVTDKTLFYHIKYFHNPNCVLWISIVIITFEIYFF